MKHKTSRLIVNTSYRSKLKIKRPVARVLAMAYYGLDLYSGCRGDLQRMARAVTLERALLLGALNENKELTDLGMKMLIMFSDKMATDGICAP